MGDIDTSHVNFKPLRQSLGDESSGFHHHHHLVTKSALDRVIIVINELGGLAISIALWAYVGIDSVVWQDPARTVIYQPGTPIATTLLVQ